MIMMMVNKVFLIFVWICNPVDVEPFMTKSALICSSSTINKCKQWKKYLPISVASYVHIRREIPTYVRPI
jgi:hypothetical protein